MTSPTRSRRSQFAERYVQFIDSLPLGVTILELVDPTTRRRSWSGRRTRRSNRSVPAPIASSIGQRLIDARPDAFRSRRAATATPPDSSRSSPTPCATSARRSSNRSMSVRRDGPELHVSIWITPLTGNYVAVLAEDVSEIVKARRTLESLAYRDPLTALPNRTALHTRARQDARRR